MNYVADAVEIAQNLPWRSAAPADADHRHRFHREQVMGGDGAIRQPERHAAIIRYPQRDVCAGPARLPLPCHLGLATRRPFNLSGK